MAPKRYFSIIKKVRHDPTYKTPCLYNLVQHSLLNYQQNIVECLSIQVFYLSSIWWTTWGTRLTVIQMSKYSQGGHCSITSNSFRLQTRYIIPTCEIITFEYNGGLSWHEYLMCPRIIICIFHDTYRKLNICSMSITNSSKI